MPDAGCNTLRPKHSPQSPFRSLIFPLRLPSFQYHSGSKVTTLTSKISQKPGHIQQQKWYFAIGVQPFTFLLSNQCFSLFTKRILVLFAVKYNTFHSIKCTQTKQRDRRFNCLGRISFVLKTFVLSDGCVRCQIYSLGLSLKPLISTYCDP